MVEMAAKGTFLARLRSSLISIYFNCYYSIITTEFKKNKIFLLEIKGLMHKVGFSKAFSKIV